MKRLALIIALAVAGIAVAAVLVFLVRAGLRYYALQKVLSIPEARHRVSVMPTERTVVPAPPTTPVNLGYATFDTGTMASVALEARGSKGTCVSVTNHDWQIQFLAPFSDGEPSGVASAGHSRYPRAAAHLDSMLADPISGQIDVERSVLLPISTIALMTSDEFMDYVLCLGQKASLLIGRSEVYFFTNAYSKGIVRIGEARNDRKRASVMLAALHDDLHLGMHVSMTATGSNDVSQVLDPILGSFRFTMAAPAKPEAVRDCIAAAGIPFAAGNSQPDGPANGSQPIRSETNRTSSAAGSRR